MELRPLSDTGIEVSAVALGCWPMAGLTSPGVKDEESLATIEACFELGVNHLDTAFNYGTDGQSERLIARALGPRRDRTVIATKGGLHWDAEKKAARDGRPETLRRQCETSLNRLGTDYVDLYYLHAPDPKVPIGESAGALKRLMEEGKTRAVGVSNVDRAQLEEFARHCPLAAFQPPYNMLQRGIEADTLPWCRERGIAVMVFWPLMKGLLSGRMRRDQPFHPRDSRHRYPQFQGEEWEMNLALVERLRGIAQRAGRTVAELVINWTIHRPGITSALCGAKRPEQIRETAAGVGWRLCAEELAAIDRALAERGPAAVRPAV